VCLAAAGTAAYIVMRTLKLTLAYDGTTYAGWQLQPGKPTVQKILEAAIEKVTGQHSSTLASGRTDAGVHALGQVVGFRTDSQLPPEVLLRAINANLPHDVAVLDAVEVPEGFRPTHDVVRKRYRYVIHDGPLRDVFGRHFAWHYRYGRLDAEAMRRAAAALLGTHDFSSFQSSGAPRATTVRTVFELRVERGRAGRPKSVGQAVPDETSNQPLKTENVRHSLTYGHGELRVERQNLPSPFGRGAGGEGDVAGEGRAGQGGGEELGIRDWGLENEDCCSVPRRRSRGACSPDSDDFITIEIEADGFLYNMVRSIVGTLVEVGRGAQPESWPGEVLLAADRRFAGPTAPPQGLFLVRVEY
jgi:tRNA pseudouridine(38-40) synthase